MRLGESGLLDDGDYAATFTVSVAPGTVLDIKQALKCIWIIITRE